MRDYQVTTSSRKVQAGEAKYGFWGRHSAEAKMDRATAKCARERSAAGIRAPRSARRVRSVQATRRPAASSDSEGEPAPASQLQGVARLSGYAAPKAGGAQ